MPAATSARTRITCLRFPGSSPPGTCAAANPWSCGPSPKAAKRLSPWTNTSWVAPAWTSLWCRADFLKFRLRSYEMKTYVAILLTLWMVFLPKAQGQTNAPLKLVQTIPLPNVEGYIDHMSVDVKGQRLFIPAEHQKSIEVVDLNKQALAFHVHRHVVNVALDIWQWDGLNQLQRRIGLPLRLWEEDHPQGHEDRHVRFHFIAPQTEFQEVCAAPEASPSWSDP